MAPWWQEGTIYQVYPRSFQDSDGDGVGDLEGIRRRLPYLSWLGVDAVWLSPFYRSPMADFGYDVSDHCDVDPLFGTLGDWDNLSAEARRLGLKLILDFVPNHTSDRHPWFAGEHRERYLWHAGTPDRPPNNWVSNFGGPAWTWDEARGAWYYHAYLPEQPDLDWRLQDVREAIADVLRFWLARGADGFRIDALRQVIKDDAWRDNPPNPDFRPGDDPYSALLPEFTTDRPEVQDVVRLIRAVVDEASARDGRERALVGELYLPIERLMAYYGSGLQLPSNLHLLSLPWDAPAIARFTEAYEAALPDGAWPNWVLGNHDRPRLATRLGPAQARAAAVLLLTLRGTPTLYYGDELGMPDVAVPPDRVHDPWELRVPGIGVGRDPVRAPMPWEDGPNAGFADPGVTPWLPVGDGVPGVAAQREDPASMLSLHRDLLALRRAEPALSGGGYRTVAATGDGLLAFERSGGGTRFLVALNLGEEPVAAPPSAGGEVVLASGGGGTSALAPGGAVVVRTARAG